MRDPRGILFVAGQTAKEGSTYLYTWDMEKQIDRVFDQVEKYVKGRRVSADQITQLRYSVTDEDLFFKHFDKGHRPSGQGRHQDHQRGDRRRTPRQAGRPPRNRSGRGALRSASTGGATGRSNHRRRPPPP
ncbi:hypothetical protein ACIPWY_04745 [Streptomyces sp. NPDC090032]|uniref:hypothetical protein n=1 Tax=Streptomyces sp. NPDC090032 TaxID=3365925 RepID=UPI0038020A17